MAFRLIRPGLRQAGQDRRRPMAPEASAPLVACLAIQPATARRSAPRRVGRAGWGGCRAGPREGPPSEVAGGRENFDGAGSDGDGSRARVKRCQVPEELSVVGFSDAGAEEAGLTTIRQYSRLAGRTAGRHLVVQVDDLDATIADLAARGVTAEPPTEPGPEIRTSCLTDPDGYRIELVQWPPGHPAGMTAADFA